MTDKRFLFKLVVLILFLAALPALVLAQDRALTRITISDFEIDCSSPGQLCNKLFEVPLEAGANSQILQLEYMVGDDHCSSIRLHIFVDGNLKATTGFLGWPDAPPPFANLPQATGLIDLGPVSPGSHLVSLQAEGQESGCNHGRVRSWGGSLTLFTTPLPLYVAAATAGTTGDGVAFGTEDILSWDGDHWALFFNGSAHGLISRHNIDAIHVPDPAGDDVGGEVYMSFVQNKIDYFPALGQVYGHDIVHFDGSDFAWYFDGSDVGLTTIGEKIDGLHLLDGALSPIGANCQAYLLISTQGSGRVRAHNGRTLSFRGEDILGFCATSTGENTDGVWQMVLDGSAVGLPKNSTDSISAIEGGKTIYLTTKGAFNVPGASGNHSMVYALDILTGMFSGPHFVAAAAGLSQQVDALHVEGDLP